MTGRSNDAELADLTLNTATKRVQYVTHMGSEVLPYAAREVLPTSSQKG